jgi:Ankyrin repeats (3 copies)
MQVEQPIQKSPVVDAVALTIVPDMTLLDEKIDVRLCSSNHGLYGRAVGGLIVPVGGGSQDLNATRKKSTQDESITLLCSSSHHSSSLRFVGASSHRRSSKLDISTDIECFSDSTTDDSSCPDDASSSYSSTFDDSSFNEFEEFASDVNDDDSKLGFVFSLEKIQSMRWGNAIPDVDSSAKLDQEPCLVVDSTVVHPRDTFRTILLQDVGCFSQRSYLVVPNGFFVEGDLKSHTYELLTAVRQGDLATIQQMNEQGLNLQCRNRFNETIVHTAARRGEFAILQYLVEQANVSPKVCCDTGRTPLHDAAWSSEPDFDTITLLLKDCPDFLGLKDARNCTPFDYIPQVAFEKWNQYLQEHRTLLLPKDCF